MLWLAVSHLCLWWCTLGHLLSGEVDELALVRRDWSTRHKRCLCLRVNARLSAGRQAQSREFARVSKCVGVLTRKRTQTEVITQAAQHAFQTSRSKRACLWANLSSVMCTAARGHVCALSYERESVGTSRLRSGSHAHSSMHSHTTHTHTQAQDAIVQPLLVCFLLLVVKRRAKTRDTSLQSQHIHTSHQPHAHHHLGQQRQRKTPCTHQQ
jgi:hypothetical protein